MELHLTPEQESRLTRIASSKGQAAQDLAQEILDLYLEQESRFVDAVKSGMDSLDRGLYVEHEEVGKRIERLFHS